MTTPSVYEDHAVRDAINTHVQAALWCDTHVQAHGPCVDQDGSVEAFHAALDVMDLPELDTELAGAEGAARQAIMDEIHRRAWRMNPRGIVFEVAAGPDGVRTRVVENANSMLCDPHC